MPVYEYACEKCKHEFEAEQRISDEPIRTCPKCRARKVKRLISRTSFVLKGSGWYSDLYASPGAKKDDAKPAESGDGGDQNHTSAVFGFLVVQPRCRITNGSVSHVTPFRSIA